MGKIVGVAKKNKLVTAGIFSVSRNAEAVVNSNGLSVYHLQTSAEVSITMLADNSSGWQKANSPDVKNVDHGPAGGDRRAESVRFRGPQELPPGKYTVILEPAAVLDLVGFMFWDFGGLAILDQRSFLNNRIGTKLFGENITIVDDVAHPLQSNAPFDGEGVGRQRVSLVEKGVIRSWCMRVAPPRRCVNRSTKTRSEKLRSRDTGFRFRTKWVKVHQYCFYNARRRTDG